MVTMKQFEVWTVELNPTKGAEINKTSRVDFKFKSETGQVVLDQIRSFDKIRLAKKNGKLDEETSENLV